MNANTPRIVIGVDTHKHVHIAHAKDHLGRPIADLQVPTTADGYAHFVAWAHSLGHVQAVGIEGTGHYGAGLARHLREAAFIVREVGRPNRQRRARLGKSDTLDAQGAAQIILAGEDLGQSKTADGTVEMLRMLRSTRASAVRARSIAITSLQNLLVTAPQEVRDRLSGLAPRQLVRTCAQLKAADILTTPTDSTLSALNALAIRYQNLDDEAVQLARHIHTHAQRACPALMELHGVGPETAATLLVAFGDNRDRITSDAAFAKLCGAAPLQASSGKTVRHRLDRGGNRQANRALHTVIIVRMRRHQPTLDYIARRTAEGKTKKEIIRCLKRYLAREIYNTVLPAQTSPKPLDAQ
ncbi:IS110 family transposase [Tsukamurella sp. DT100]|uniref:IS110 family transposase n=1 Tax=Tsukamurella sp. DT100 TaxID=3393415 RepID=UPI003CE9F69C